MHFCCIFPIQLAKLHIFCRKSKDLPIFLTSNKNTPSKIRGGQGALKFFIQNGPRPKQLVVVIAVRNAVSAATIIFTANSIILCFVIR